MIINKDIYVSFIKYWCTEFIIEDMGEESCRMAINNRYINYDKTMFNSAMVIGN